MDKFDSHQLEDIYQNRIKRFQKLMRYKVREILLVSSLYDSYLFEEDGRLYELIREEYQVLNLSQAPEITHVTTGAEALEVVGAEIDFDLIIITLHIEDMHPVRFAEKMKKSGSDTPIVLLAYDNKERKELTDNYDISVFENIFIWNGDYRLLIAIIKCVEDKRNVENDAKNVGVQVVILVEDNIKFYSAYLPQIYQEIFRQSQRLIQEGINLTHKYLRMRARPKILLSTTYEEAWGYYEKYSDYILGIITDNNFKKGGERDPQAGIKLARAVKEKHPDISILVQSSTNEFEQTAYQIGAAFLLKGSPRLLHDLSEFMLNNFGFGDFVFRTTDGNEVGRASNLQQMEDVLRVVPDDAVKYHADRNHFSNWLKARTEFWLANQLRPKKLSDFASVNDLRLKLIETMEIYRELRQRGVITDFSRESFNPKNSFARIGSGSLGGKARGLGFINNLINNHHVRNKFEGVELIVPSAVVVATGVFDSFLDMNNLEQFGLTEEDDKVILERFLNAPHFPDEIVEKLREFISLMQMPLAVRSSSLLEDSQFQPFAGVYQTCMIPNNNPDPETRLDELLKAIKFVYASTFFKSSKDYMKATSYRLEEEKMAVVVQRLVGAKFDGRFYPHFAGVAKSYNFYPVAPQKSSDGIAYAALGLGRWVVEGGNTVRFCPKYPKHLLQFYSPKETMRNSQQEFFALDLNSIARLSPQADAEVYVTRHSLDQAEEDGTLAYVGSTYSPENEAVFDGLSRKGERVVTFAPIFKHKVFPLAEILNLLLTMGAWGMGAQVEIEFAVNLEPEGNQPAEFAMLQMRPLVISSEAEELKIGHIKKSEMIAYSEQVLGNGIITGIHDVILVDLDTFDRGKSREVALEVSRFNSKMLAEKKPYILIGVGRWGSKDDWLGIPVTWDQISGAAVIVESDFKDFTVTPSQGSHFFQNITSFRVGYFTVHPDKKSGFIDWSWLRLKQPLEEMVYTKHIRFDHPIEVKINGHKSKGVILKPREE